MSAEELLLQWWPVVESGRHFLDWHWYEEGSAHCGRCNPFIDGPKKGWASCKERTRKQCFTKAPSAVPASRFLLRSCPDFPLKDYDLRIVRWNDIFISNLHLVILFIAAKGSTPEPFPNTVIINSLVLYPIFPPKKVESKEMWLDFLMCFSDLKTRRKKDQQISNPNI